MKSIPIYSHIFFRFSWVTCRVDAIRRCIKSNDLEEALGNLPITLDETYDRIILNIKVHVHHDTAILLQWLAFSYWPMSLEALWHALVVKVKDPAGFDKSELLRSPLDVLLL